ncbi:DNA polymerase III PolC-type [Poriferisphaera corsica]|uniref:DNA polymerase III PolC-type n=1 Tax=Poriferisphaera corsica TaxID=2528020 RepID=A0A517YUD3_9BACT|nr:exonuclease domain-containing protein [Poriferisphaera corsica]QDU33772.1 DNA polymerase III PolC-type [Poriferisphaera corsica]
MINNFAAIDFETANRGRNSACAVGIAIVENGKIAKKYSSLIRPPSLNFLPEFIRIHGITAEDVADAPSFEEIWPKVHQICADGLVVAHNAAFDISVLQNNIYNGDLSCLSGKYCCTCNLAKKLLPGLRNHKLGTLAKVFGLNLKHHDALSDAITCAELAMRLFRLAGPKQLEGHIKEFAEFGMSQKNSTNAVCLEISTNELGVSHIDFDTGEGDAVDVAAPDGRFDGKKFVFTGELMFLNRSEATEIVEIQGGRVIGSVSKKTDIVVVGDEVYEAYEESGKTTGKLSKAAQLNDAGGSIEIVSESDFLDMIE